MRRLSVGLAVLMMAVSAAVASAAPPTRNEAETNNTAGTSSFLGDGPCYRVGAGAINPGGDIDFWDFSAVNGNRFWMNVDTGGTQGAGATSRDSTAQLLASDGTTLIESDDDDGTGNGGDGTVETGLASAITGRQLPASGTNYVRIAAFSATAVINPYKMFVATTSAAPVSESEPNNAPGAANPTSCRVPVDGTLTAGDVDHFRVQLAAGETVFFAADADPARTGTGTDLVLAVKDAAGTGLLNVDSSITGSLSNPAGEAADFTAPAAGDYTIAVKHFSPSGTGTYRLLVAAENDPPDTSIDSGPTGTTGDPTPTFAFNGSDDVTAELGFQCSVVATGQPPSFGPCNGTGRTHTPAALRNGSYTLSVRAVDGNGHVDESPATRDFNVVLSGKASVKSISKSVTINLKTGKGKGKFSCANIPDDRCRVSLSLTAKVKVKSSKTKTVKLGKASGTVAGGKRGTLTFKLSKSGLKRLKKARRHRLKVRALGRSRNNAGAKTTIKKTITLKGKNPKRKKK